MISLLSQRYALHQHSYDHLVELLYLDSRLLVTKKETKDGREIIGDAFIFLRASSHNAEHCPAKYQDRTSTQSEQPLSHVPQALRDSRGSD